MSKVFKVFDCFPFYDELDLLEIRLNILNDVVDYFVLTEATRTFTGKPKPLHYDNNKVRFKKFEHKIRHVIVDDTEFKPEIDAWQRGFDQKNSVFSFPVGSVLIKTFSYEPINNQRPGRHIIETRLLIRKDSGWDALTYVWDEEGQEATLALAGKTVKANYISNEGRQLDIRYRVPNKNQCKECHLENESIVPIGPKPRNLNRDYTYLEGTMNQLEKWMSVKFIESYPEKINSVVDFMDSSKPINDRARAYLDINCGHCHAPEGSASNSGLYLDLLETREKQLGVFKGPVATGRGSGGLDYSIVPGHPDESILLYRMISDAPDIMMPESGRSVMHKEAVDIIYQWIEEME